MSRAIILYLHVHQPYRLRHYTIFDAGVEHNYFDSQEKSPANNIDIIRKVSEKSYLPTNKILLDLLNQYPEFHLSLSLTGTVIEQFERWAPETLQSFKDLVETGRVEILAETYHHSLSFFYSKEEFELQVEMHRKKIESVFGQTPTVFRNTELAYNNDVAYWADKAGYKGILAEGWEKFLDWRSPNFVYRPKYTDNIRLLMKNYHLSDDIAFRFCDHDWKEWPLTADKFCHWLNETKDGTNFNLFMDYETFGEHQWVDSGILDFLKSLPGEWLKNSNNSFMTISQAIDAYEPVEEIDIPETVTWADTERDLSAWLGNPMQQEAIKALYDIRSEIISTNDPVLIEDWRRLQTSDHFYYMCTKWFNDGDIHAYFSPYDTPYIGFMNYMNAWHDIRYRLSEHGIGI
ncbi:MAG TPA: glycoside hydrolase family 57 protein [Candidatus Saccharimonadales bacterium]|jgi:alpha-amylase|nr:glycoside hydrolase family 57 protein [Candidatus Saccharimonadales bacterium]